MPENKNQIEKLQRAENLLPEDEKTLYREFKESGKPPLGPTLSIALFELYVNGSSIRDIHKLNKVYDLGAIVDAKIRYSWDEQKDKYLSELFSKARNRLLQVQMESAEFFANAMAATHKKYGDALKRYLQTGDESGLGGFDLGSIAQYNKAIDGIMKVTGQDKKKEVTINSSSDTSIKDITKQALSEEQAAKILEILAVEDDGNN